MKYRVHDLCCGKTLYLDNREEAERFLEKAGHFFEERVPQAIEKKNLEIQKLQLEIELLQVVLDLAKSTRVVEMSDEEAAAEQAEAAKKKETEELEKTHNHCTCNGSESCKCGGKC